MRSLSRTDAKPAANSCGACTERARRPLRRKPPQSAAVHARHSLSPATLPARATRQECTAGAQPAAHRRKQPTEAAGTRQLHLIYIWQPSLQTESMHCGHGWRNGTYRHSSSPAPTRTSANTWLRTGSRANGFPASPARQEPLSSQTPKRGCGPTPAISSRPTGSWRAAASASTKRRSRKRRPSPASCANA